MSGWIKLHRSTQESAIASHPEYLAVWVHLLMRAQYSDSECVIGRSVLKLSPGQLVFGRIKFASQVGISEAKVRAALDVMKSLNMITIKSMAKFSIISITNWKKYQEDNQQIAAESPASNQQLTSNQPASDHIQEGKELQEGKESKELKPIIPKNKFSDDDKKCAEWLADKLQEFIPDCKRPNINSWAKDVRDMHTLDNRSHKEICQLWVWCRKDGFEAANVQSPAKLRKRYDQLKTKMNNQAAGISNGYQPRPANHIDDSNTDWINGIDPRVFDRARAGGSASQQGSAGSEGHLSGLEGCDNQPSGLRLNAPAMAHRDAGKQDFD